MRSNAIDNEVYARLVAQGRAAARAGGAYVPGRQPGRDVGAMCASGGAFGPWEDGNGIVLYRGRNSSS